MRNISYAIGALLLAAATWTATAQTPTANEISADLGACSAEIKVMGAGGKPVHSARVATRIQYGFAGVKRLDLEAYTDYNGKVKIVGLPDKQKKPLLIRISNQGPEVLVEFKPEEACHAQYTVALP